MTEPEEPEAGGSPDRFVPIAFLYSLPEAAVLECTLRAYGIPAFQPDYWTGSIEPPWMVAIGGLRVEVPESRRDDAIALLYEIDRGWTRPPNIYAKENWLNVLLAILVVLFTMVPPPPRARGSYAWRRRQESDSPAR